MFPREDIISIFSPTGRPSKSTSVPSRYLEPQNLIQILPLVLVFRTSLTFSEGQLTLVRIWPSGLFPDNDNKRIHGISHADEKVFPSAASARLSTPYNL